MCGGVGGGVVESCRSFSNFLILFLHCKTVKKKKSLLFDFIHWCHRRSDMVVNTFFYIIVFAAN